MRNPGKAAGLLAFSIFVPTVLVGQSVAGLSITNYQVVSQTAARFRNNVTYRADLVNSGLPLGPVTATLTSKNLNSFTVAPGQGTLNFTSSPANSQVTSTNTVLLLVNPAVPFDLANLQWDFSASPLPPTANAGPNQAAKLGTTVILDGSASTNPSGLGTLSYNWAFTSRPGGSGAQLTNPTSVMPSFVLDAPGNYVIGLTVTSTFNSTSSTATVTVSTIYTPPVANAGFGQTVSVGSTVVLNGSASTDVNGQPLSYSWTLITRPPGSAAFLKTATSVSPTFVADKSGSYLAQLVVNDGQSNSIPATVSITTLNSPPVANAGHNQLVHVGDLAQLNGSGSTDVDGDPLTYKWSLLSVPAGSLAALNDPTLVNPAFTIDLAGTYVAQLIVNDGTFDSKPVTALLTTDMVLAPVANPGPNQTISHGTIATLNGSGTDPQGLPLTFQWTLLNKPVGSAASLSSTSIASPTFIADLPGAYVAQLIVSNPYLDSAPATVTVTTTNTPPVANAGPSQTVMLNANVTLDGSASFDADHDPLKYSWSLLSRPVASNATLSSANTLSPMFVADVPGTYIAQLIINDGFANSDPATVTVTAIQTAKLSLSPSPLNMSTAGPATLTLTLAAPAGQGGQFIGLTSFNTSIATVPASVTVPEGATGVNVTVTPGTTAGTSAIYASAPTVQGTFVIVNVVAASITVGTDSAIFGPARTTNGTITLSSPAPAGGLPVTLSATPPGIVDVEPPVVLIQGGSATGAFAVTGLALGGALITASAPGFTSGFAGVSIVLVGFIFMPPTLNVGLGQSIPFPVTLATPAPLGGATITLKSDNTSKVSITPSVFIPFRATTPATPATANGINFGTASITASSPGFIVSNATQVTVTATLSFTPPSLSITGMATGNLTLTLSGLAPASGLVVSLHSDNTGVATVPPTATFQPFNNIVNVPVTGVKPGSTVIHASSATLADTTASVTV